MSLQLSTGLRNMMLGITPPAAHVATLTADTNGDIKAATTSTFTDVDSRFVTSGFAAGDAIIAHGFAGDMKYIVGPFTIVTCVAGTITVSGTPLVADAAATEKVTITCVVGGSLRDIFKCGVLKIYTGTQPTTADLAATGTLLLTISVGSGTFTPGAVTNGLEFGVAASGSISKLSTQTWSGVAVATGTAGWFRLYGNATDAGTISTTLPRIDGAVATSGAQLNMSSTSITTGATTTIDTFTITLPAA